MDHSVRSAVIDAVLDHGPITFAEYMELCLYGPGGYYEDPPVGAGGDFITSPHVHPVFAELLAQAIRELWDRLGRPQPLRMAEVGAGDGTLAAALLGAGAMPPCRYTAIDRSPGARAALTSIEGLHVDSELPAAPHLVLANELLDNLPFRRVRMTAEGPREIRVGVQGDRLAEMLTESGPELAGAIAGAETGDEVVVPDGAFAFLDELAARMERGYALLIDYGGVGSSGGLTHGYREHRLVDDVLEAPGRSDITAGIDFESIAEHARGLGFAALETVSQRDALTALGFDRWVGAERSRQHRLLEARDGAGAVRAWSDRSRATLLVDPGALGRFRWLLLATPGLPAPLWLDRAARLAVS